MARDGSFAIVKGEAKRAGDALPPGATIGILGGGQLGRMLSAAAAQLGYKCHIYAPEQESIAGEVSAQVTSAAWTDREALARFAQSCDVITWEFENVPVAPLAAIPDYKLAPHPRALETAQDRLLEKRFVESLGGRAAPFHEVDTRNDLETALERIGVPGILKTRRDGYDGKGQWRISSEHEADGLALHEGGFVYEGLVRFEAEFSVIVARGADGEIRFWDSPQNVHEHGILARSFLPPAPLVLGQVEAARQLARAVAEALKYVGVFALEFFATSASESRGPVFNEMAPRVHNSGHWTIEGAVTSQFENHIRAVCNLPLGDTSLVSQQVEMRNLVGDEALTAHQLLADGANHLHLYGKAEARAGRKMGHVTRLGPTPGA
ncbi:MAG TPA: 5-(carboxyamino)imidazole ribonucleotide synthase [Sphingomonadaceae bacterium]|nr:5-(carboxyamino)imidazole ribonucleotide synthase [Sphingomonadaceae bacterium]